MWLQIVDPMLATYGAQNPVLLAIEFATHAMRQAISKMTLDRIMRILESGGKTTLLEL